MTLCDYEMGKCSAEDRAAYQKIYILLSSLVSTCALSGMGYPQQSDWTHLRKSSAFIILHATRRAESRLIHCDWPRIRNVQLCPGGSEEQVVPYKYSLRLINEHRHPTDLHSSTGLWYLLEGCCSKLSRCPVGVRLLWSSGWRGGQRA